MSLVSTSLSKRTICVRYPFSHHPEKFLPNEIIPRKTHERHIFRTSRTDFPPRLLPRQDVHPLAPSKPIRWKEERRNWIFPPASKDRVNTHHEDMACRPQGILSILPRCLYQGSTFDQWASIPEFL